MDTKLFNSIAQTLKKNFYHVPDVVLLKNAREIYDKEIQKREEIDRLRFSTWKNESQNGNYVQDELTVQTQVKEETQVFEKTNISGSVG